MTNPQHSLPLICIVVLNWNGLSDTIYCLKSLDESDYPNWSVVVVDNGSSNDEAKMIRTRYPHATVLETGKNLGYAGGNNVGLEYAARQEADYILVLNNDTEVSPGCLSALVEIGEANPNAGAIGCFVYSYAAPRPFLYAGLHAYADPYIAVMGRRYDTEVLGAEAAVSVDSAHGCGFAIRRTAYETVGGFDERFFAVHEEVDWCMRAREASFEILAAPHAIIWHKIAASFGGLSPNRRYYDVRNMALYYHNRANGKRLSYAWWRSFAQCTFRFFWDSVRQHQREHAVAALEAGWAGFRNQGGQRSENHRLHGLVSALILAAKLRTKIRPPRLLMRMYWYLNAHLFSLLPLRQKRGV
jgi:GT2 family glycosyltransferase